MAMIVCALKDGNMINKDSCAICKHYNGWWRSCQLLIDKYIEMNSKKKQ